jgi:hypothetical protein
MDLAKNVDVLGRATDHKIEWFILLNVGQPLP